MSLGRSEEVSGGGTGSSTGSRGSSRGAAAHARGPSTPSSHRRTTATTTATCTTRSGRASSRRLGSCSTGTCCGCTSATSDATTTTVARPRRRWRRLGTRRGRAMGWPCACDRGRPRLHGPLHPRSIPPVLSLDVRSRERPQRLTSNCMLPLSEGSLLVLLASHFTRRQSLFLLPFPRTPSLLISLPSPGETGARLLISSDRLPPGNYLSSLVFYRR